jgi:hypothetical protein
MMQGMGVAGYLVYYEKLLAWRSSGLVVQLSSASESESCKSNTARLGSNLKAEISRFFESSELKELFKVSI